MHEDSGESRAIAMGWLETICGQGDDVREPLHDGLPIAGADTTALANVDASARRVHVEFFSEAEIFYPKGQLGAAGTCMGPLDLRGDRAVNASALTKPMDAQYAEHR